METVNQVTADMGYGEWIRRERRQLGLTQRQLGERVGATDGFISHLEKELRVPSLELAMAMAQVFGFSQEEQQEFLEMVDAARVARARRRIETRGEAARGALRSRAEAASAPRSPSRLADLPDPESIARDLKANPELAAAFDDLLTAYSDPEYREAVLKTLRGLAASARSG